RTGKPTRGARQKEQPRECGEEKRRAPARIAHSEPDARSALAGGSRRTLQPNRPDGKPSTSGAPLATQAAPVAPVPTRHRSAKRCRAPARAAHPANSAPHSTLPSHKESDVMIDCAFYGFLAADAETKVSKAGKPWTRMRVGVGKDDDLQWVFVAAFGKAAETAAELHQSVRVSVGGT